MISSYSGIHGAIAPEESWDYVMKMEPYSPQGSLNNDSSSYSSQSPESIFPQFHHGQPSLNGGYRAEQFLTDGSFETLMSLEKSTFMKVPSADIQKLLAEEGDPFDMATRYGDRSPAFHPYNVPSERPVRSSTEWNDSTFPAPFSVAAKQPTFFIGGQELHRQSSSETSAFAKSPDSSPLSSPLPSDKESTPPQKIKRRTKHNKKYGHILWKFCLELLMNSDYKDVICWTGDGLTCKVIDKERICDLWSAAKPRQCNTKIPYESFTRGIRAYKKKNGPPPIMAHTQESTFTYVFHESYSDKLSEEVGMPFSDILKFARRAGSDC